MPCVTHVTTLSRFMNTGLSEKQHRGLYWDVICFDRKYATHCTVGAFYCGKLYKDEVLKNSHSKFKTLFPGVFISSKLTMYRLVRIFRTKVYCS
jgi:hypothetical protein